MYSSAYVWAKILGYLEQRLTEPVVSAWLDDAEVLEFTNSQLVIYSPTEFRKEMIVSRCYDHIKNAMKELFDLEVHLVVLGEDQVESFRSTKRQMNFLDFNPQFTFEKFVVGASNHFAQAAALAMATPGDPPQGYNPLFLYGPPGLGKTHLLYAIADRIHRREPDANIVYIKGDQFTNELIQAIREGQMIAFREKYRNADVFLVDDIQFIAGKDSTQEEYFHTFNALYENRKKIIMAADRPPASMQKLEDRLRTRFEWGITTEISPPDYETRMAILRNYAMNAGLELSDDVAAFIAENVTSDVRRLEGAVNKLKATMALENLPIDLNLVSRVLKNLKPEGKQVPTPSLIFSEVCRFYSIDEQVVRSNQKNKAVAEARHIIAYLLDTMLNLSSTDIGKELDRDHSTVLYSLNKIRQLIKSPTSGISDNIRDITSNINGKL